MYDIYIKNYLNSSGNIVTSEALLYSIPISDSQQDRSLIDPSVKTEMGKAGSMDFSMHPNHAFYNAFQQMKTIIRVVYDGTTIFRGRTLTIDDSPFTGDRKIHLEGDFAFLMDSQVPGIKEEDRQTVSIHSYLLDIINRHNAQMRANGEEDKTFVLGEVPGGYSSSITTAQRLIIPDNTFGDDSWRRTMDELENLKKEYGGVFRTRYANGYAYLDWLQSYYSSSVNTSQPIQVASNMIDVNSTTEVENLFTVLIPIGDNKGEPLYIEGYTPPGKAIRGSKAITVPEIAGLYSTSELERGYHHKSDYENAIRQYGTIYKVQQFQNAKTQDVLWSYAIDWMKNNYVGGIRNFTITVFDLHHIDSSKQKYLTGDQVKIIYPDMSKHTSGNTPTIDRNLTILSIQYKLHNPEQNSYSIGVPSDLLNKQYGKASKKSTEKQESVPEYNGTPEHSKEVYSTIQEYKQLANNYVVNHRYNNDIYEQLYRENPKKAELAFTSTEIAIVEGLMASDSRPTSGTHKKRVQKIMLDGMQGSLTINGPVDHSVDFTDEQVALINKNNCFAILDATRQRFGLNAVMDLISPEVPAKPTHTLLDLKIQMNKAGLIDLYGEDKKTDENAKQKVSMTGLTGTICNIANMLGLNGAGDAVTTIIDGAASLFNMKPTNKAGSTIKTDITTQINGNLGEMAAQFQKAGTGFDANGNIKSTLVNDGLNAIMKAFPKNKAGSTNKTDITAQISGDLGEMASKLQKVGTGFDSYGNILSTIMQDGPNAIMSMFPKDKAGSTTETDKTVNITGGSTVAGLEGAAQFGRNSSSGWRVMLNEKVTYTDADGIEHVACPGFVVCEDMKIKGIDEIPSFSTKLAIIDSVLADQVITNRLVVNNDAWIKKLTGSTYSADTYVRAYLLSCATLTANTSVTAGNFYWSSGSSASIYKDGDAGSLSHSIHHGLFREGTYNSSTQSYDKTTGAITLELYNWKGEVESRPNFNIAATQFYQNAVAAARNNGYDANHSMFITGSNDTPMEAYSMGYGESKNFYPTFSKIGGGLQYGTKVTVTAPSDRYNTGYDANHSMFITGGDDKQITTYSIGYGATANFYPTFSKVGGGKQYGTKVTVTGPADRYETGWSGCYKDIGLNYSSAQTLNPGGSITVYPAAKPSSSGDHASITSKGVTVSARALNLQEKTVSPMGNEQTVKPDSGKDGLSSVKVSAISGWYTGGWLVYADASSGQDHQGTLEADRFVRVVYSDPAGVAHYTPTWKTPSSGGTGHSISINNLGTAGNGTVTANDLEKNAVEIFSDRTVWPHQYYYFEVHCGGQTKKYYFVINS